VFTVNSYLSPDPGCHVVFCCCLMDEPWRSVVYTEGSCPLQTDVSTL